MTGLNFFCVIDNIITQYILVRETAQFSPSNFWRLPWYLVDLDHVSYGSDKICDRELEQININSIFRFQCRIREAMTVL